MRDFRPQRYRRDTSARDFAVHHKRLEEGVFGEDYNRKKNRRRRVEWREKKGEQKKRERR